MFQVCGRIKSCRVALLKMKREHQINSGKAIRELKAKMEGLQQQGKDRNWAEWQQLQKDLEEEYRKKEIFWQQKSRIQWLKEGDRNIKFFHAHTLQRRKRNCIERLLTAQGMVYSTVEHIEKEVTSSYQSLFTTSHPAYWEESLEALNAL